MFLFILVYPNRNGMAPSLDDSLQTATHLFGLAEHGTVITYNTGRRFRPSIYYFSTSPCTDSALLSISNEHDSHLVNGEIFVHGIVTIPAHQQASNFATFLI